MSKYPYYVVLRRYMKEEDLISIYSFEEAVKGNWITEEGDRVWVVPPEHEYTATFVWGFEDLDVAVMFYESLRAQELGIKVREV